MNPWFLGPGKWYCFPQEGALASSPAPCNMLSRLQGTPGFHAQDVGPVFGQPATSVLVGEKAQCDTQRLACGARTLFVESATGAVLFRGINKFFDFHDIDSSILSQLPTGSHVFLQRKMAGFVVHVWSEDGETLRFASKHAIQGPHVDAACRIWTARYAVCTASVARWLHTHQATLSGECIDVAFDANHPIVDNAFDQRIVFFAAHRCSSILEETLPLQILASLGLEWGIDVAPTLELEPDGLVEQVARLQLSLCEPTFKVPPGRIILTFADAPVAEGFVLAVEVPTTVPSSLFTVVPFRLKIKSPYYTLRRTMRSCLESGRLLAMSPVCRLLAEKFALWIQEDEQRLETVRQLKCLPQFSAQFDAFLASVNSTLLSECVMDIHRRQITKHTVVLLCGLPGCGKSTFAAAVGDHFSGHGVMVIARDEITEKQLQSTGAAARRKSRIGAAVHVEMARRLRELLNAADSMMIVLDACHATAESRAHWLQSVSRRHRRLIVTFPSLPLDQLASRVANREGHAVVKPEAAELAVSTVFKLWAVPTKDEAEALGVELWRSAQPSDLFELVPKPLAPPQTAASDHRSADPFLKVFLRPAHARVVSLSTPWELPLIQAFIQALRSPDECGIISGHTQWICPFLFGAKTVPTSDSDAWELISRKYTVSSDLHVTLLHPRDNRVPTAVSEKVQLLRDCPCPFAVTSFLVDRNAICARVTMPSLDATGLSNMVFLHVTMALRRDVPPSYCATLPQLFLPWEQQLSEAIAAKRSRAEGAATKVLPAPSFAELRASEPLELEGIVSIL